VVVVLVVVVLLVAVAAGIALSSKRPSTITSAQTTTTLIQASSVGTQTDRSTSASSTSVSSSSSSSSASGLSVRVGDYAQYNGTISTGLLTVNETDRLQVVLINASGVEWVQDTVAIGQSSQSAYMAQPGASPFHDNNSVVNGTFTFIRSYDIVRLIGSTAYNTTALVYINNADGSNTTETYYYLKGTTFMPIEVTSQTSSNDVTSVADDLYLTATNIPGISVVQP